MGHLDDDPNWECRHHKMLTKEHRAALQREVKSFEAGLPKHTKQLETIWSKSKITPHLDPRLQSTPMQRKEITSIHFDVSKATRKSRSTYTQHLTNDLKLRGLPLDGLMIERQERLKVQLTSEWVYRESSDALKKFGKNNAKSALVVMMDMVPCILHLEIRMGIKILSMLFKIGMTNSKQGILPWMTTHDKYSDKTAAEAYRDKVQDLANREILGTEKTHSSGCSHMIRRSYRWGRWFSIMAKFGTCFNASSSL